MRPGSCVVRRAALGAAVVAALAVDAPAARAEGASPWDAEPLRSTAVGAATGQAPLRLLRPIASETVARALREAEALYRDRQFAVALHAYGTLVGMDPSLARAWLRLGNLHQQAGREDEALDAYRQAALGPGAVSPDVESRGKALLNIALLAVAQAGRAIDEFDALETDALDEARHAVARQAGAQRRRAQRATARWTEGEGGRAAAPSALGPQQAGFAAPVAAPPATAPRQSAPWPQAPWPQAPMQQTPMQQTPMQQAPWQQAPWQQAPFTAPAAAAAPAPVAPARPSGDAQDAVEPYTVDRWSATPRRAPARRDTGRGRLSEPVVETPLAPLPAVETFRGLQGGMRP